MSLEREAQARRRIVDLASNTGDVALMSDAFRHHEHAIRYDTVHIRRKQALWNAASRIEARTALRTGRRGRSAWGRSRGLHGAAPDPDRGPERAGPPQGKGDPAPPPPNASTHDLGHVGRQASLFSQASDDAPAGTDSGGHDPGHVPGGAADAPSAADPPRAGTEADVGAVPGRSAAAGPLGSGSPDQPSLDGAPAPAATHPVPPRAARRTKRTRSRGRVLRRHDPEAEAADAYAIFNSALAVAISATAPDEDEYGPFHQPHSPEEAPPGGAPLPGGAAALPGRGVVVRCDRGPSRATHAPARVPTMVRAIQLFRRWGTFAVHSATTTTARPLPYPHRFPLTPALGATGCDWKRAVAG